jgi:hypothetical protein
MYLENDRAEGRPPAAASCLRAYARFLVFTARTGLIG